jgi:hypothetical protein
LESLKILKGQSEAINRRTDNEMASESNQILLNIICAASWKTHSMTDYDKGLDGWIRCSGRSTVYQTNVVVALTSIKEV